MIEELEKDPAKQDLLILCNGRDEQIGTATKAEAHAQGLLHRAFSLVLVRDGEKGPEVLLAQRAEGKYHSAGLWANSCCSHPRDGEALEDAVPRRCREELGVGVADLRELCSFIYRAEFENGLCEYEYDHVFLGRATGEADPDPAEVADTRWVAADALSDELAAHPERFCAWAFTVLGTVLQELQRE